MKNNGEKSLSDKIFRPPFPIAKMGIKSISVYTSHLISEFYYSLSNIFCSKTSEMSAYKRERNYNDKIYTQKGKIFIKIQITDAVS